jgi:L-ascorbate metabolism protein UlaG (beta-lactamase superfamily)
MTKTLALRSAIRSTPMVNSWFAHPFLVSPLTFGLFTKHAHLSMLDSFIDDPQQHRTSARTPELRGGPFIDYDGDPQDMRRFRDQTLQRCEVPLRYADAINRMYQVLHGSARGAGVAGLYAQIDPLLRGCTEIVYDVSKQPCARFVEPLFYRSAACDLTLQSCVLERVNDRPRPFALSTPQLARGPQAVELRLPFGNPLWDRLYQGVPAGPGLADLLAPHLDDPGRDLGLLQDLMSEAAPPGRYQPPPSDTVRIRYLGHACVLLESARVSILFDPLLSYPGESDVDHFTFDDLPPHIDYVVITHPHQDHVVLETLLRLRHKVGQVVVGRCGGGGLQDPSLRLCLEHCGFTNVRELGEYEEIALDGGRLIGAPFFGEHADLDVRAKLVYGVELEGRSCLFFADSNPPEPEFYEPLRRLMPRIDMLFLGMECVGAPATWLYGPVLQKLMTRGEDQSRRLDGCNAATAARLRDYFQPERLYVYAMGAEPWITHLTSILYSEEAPQFKEARALERSVRGQGGHAELLFGKLELLL